MPNYDAKAIKINWLNHEVIGLNVETTQKISYEAGQFMMINFHKNGKETPKAYSIANAPSKNRNWLEFVIKYYEDGVAGNELKKMKETKEKNITLNGPFGKMICLNSPPLFFI